MRVLRRNIPNNNKTAIKILVRASLKHHKGRNIILAGTAALSILVLCTVFSIALGKIDAEYLQMVRSAGTAASTYLERGTMEQYEALRKLDYVRDVGKIWGAGDAYAEGQYVSGLQALDTIAWEELMRPAYTHIHGHYPKENGEIMLPVRALDAMNIRQPEEGMEIVLSVMKDDLKERRETFTLCGWYTDYMDPAVSGPVGYISEAQLESWGISLQEPDLLAIRQKNTIDEYEIEEKLYEDIPTRDKAQQFLGGNTYAYSVLNDFTGGYRMAAFCGILVLASVFFLIQNVLEMSIQKEIRQMGLLDTLGMTQRQIRSFYFCQTSVLLLFGIITGSAWALLSVLVLVPQALGNLYLVNFGKSSDLLVYRPGVFAAAIIFTSLVILAAAVRAVYKASRLSPLEALHYMGMTEKADKAGRSQGRKKKRFILGKRMILRELLFMAWQNLLRYKKRFLLTVLSLFLGVTTALGSAVLTKGTDYTNSIEKRKDFAIDGQPFILMGDTAYYRDDFSPISGEVKEKLLAVKGIKEESITTVRGAYLAMDMEDPAFEPLMEAGAAGEKAEESEESKKEQPDRQDIEENTLSLSKDEESIRQPLSVNTATVQIVDDAYISELEEYVSRNHLKADMKSLRDGTGMVLLHYHLLSPTLQKEADQKAGSFAVFWRLPSRQESEEAVENTAGEFIPERFTYREAAGMAICGYLDTQAKGFPELKKTWFGPGIWYFLVSEKGFARLGTKEKTFKLEFDTAKDREASAKVVVSQILQEENREQGQELVFVLCKSDELADAQSYIRTNRIIMGALSLVLIFMGLMNYFNVLVTGMFARQKELAVMESVGMTERQIQSMLIAEGGIYCGIILALVLTAGSGILKLIHLHMDTRIAYFKFYYPWNTMFLILLFLLFICIGVPLLVHRHMERQSLPLRISDW